MKKTYTTSKYKIWNKRRSIRYQKYRRNKSSYKILQFAPQLLTIEKATLSAPKDFRLLENTEKCLEFFRNLRNADYRSSRGALSYITTTLRYVTKIDYAAVSILTALNDDLKYQRVQVKGDLPDNRECSDFMVACGFLNNLFEPSTGRPFQKNDKNDMIFFEKGMGILSESEMKKISTTVQKVVKHLIDKDVQSKSINTIIKEICGNSIEWAGTTGRQWLLGVKYDTEKVVFTVSDVGNGILETLHRNVPHIIKDKLKFQLAHEILEGAFDQKYGSTSKDVNRNKGLPSIKSSFEKGNIENLKVITNNVILHFNKPKSSKTFQKGLARFKGTFYQWEMTKKCLEKLNIK